MTYTTKKHTSKKGNAALGWLLVIALALAVIGIIYPSLRTGVGEATVQVADEMDNTMDTIDDRIIYHPDSD